MISTLTICECGLLAWTVWHLQPYARPAFCLLILTMLACAAAYHIPRPDSEFRASAMVE